MLIIIDVLTYYIGGSTQTLTFELDPDSYHPGIASSFCFYPILHMNVPRARVV